MAPKQKKRKPQKPLLAPAEARKSRMVGLALALIVFILLIYLGTFAKLWG